ERGRTMPSPLEGMQVLEAGFFQNGPQAGKFLAELGAEVIKIEPPRVGDPGRGFPGLERNPSYLPYFESHNRAKKSITLDLRRSGGSASASARRSRHPSSAA